MRTFYQKFYSDNRPRLLMLGINPGRFGAGITGINFTAPRQLNEYCGIDHPWDQSTELSAAFIYEMIEAAGGPSRFFGECYIGSICPLGLTRDKKNLNYYDDPALLKKIGPFILKCLQQQVSWPLIPRKCIVIGGEKNRKYLESLNQQHNWFDEIVALPHPRFIMQYRRKEKDAFVRMYLETVRSLKFRV
jgi:hypothetical protein